MPAEGIHSRSPWRSVRVPPLQRIKPLLTDSPLIALLCVCSSVGWRPVDAQLEPNLPKALSVKHAEAPPNSVLQQDTGQVVSDGKDVWRAGPNCGRNAAYALARLEGGSPPPYSVFEAVIPVGVHGSSLHEVVSGLRQCGVACDAVRAAPSDLTPGRLPIIVHFDQFGGSSAIGHYSVLIYYNEAEDTAITLDGANGIERRLNIDPFRRTWSGYAILPRRVHRGWRYVEIGCGVAVLVLAGLLLRSRNARVA